MNNVQLAGRMARDVDFNAEKKVARFSVACNRQYKNKETGKYDADFISCVAFGSTGEFISKYFSKGSGIVLNGRIQTGSYEKDGRTVYTTDVLVENAEFPQGGNANGNGASVPKAAPNVSVPETDKEELPWV